LEQHPATVTPKVPICCASKSTRVEKIRADGTPRAHY
jgi:hypothetical protein